SDYVNEVVRRKIKYGFDKIDSSYIKQLKYVLDEIKNSEGINKIEKQINDQLDKDSVYNELIKYEIKVNKIINQLKECLDKLNDSGDASKIKKQFKDQLDKINVPDYVNKLIKFKIKRWLGEIKVSNKVNKIKKKQEISYWLDIIKGLDNMDEINKIKGSNDLDEIITQINDWLDKIDDIDKIKTQINLMNTCERNKYDLFM
ncbi:3222_t:CDS:2, partial [Gigaspora rosea]